MFSRIVVVAFSARDWSDRISPVAMAAIILVGLAFITAGGVVWP